MNVKGNYLTVPFANMVRSEVDSLDVINRSIPLRGREKIDILS